MSAPLKTVPYNNNTGGLNRVSGPPNIRPYEWEDGGNLDIDPDGSIRQRDGMSLVGLAHDYKLDLVSWWRMEEAGGTRFDQGEGRNHLPATGAPVSETGKEGTSAITLATGANVSIVSASQTELDKSGLTDFSIAFWFKWPSMAAAHEMLVGRGNALLAAGGGVDDSYHVLINGTAGGRVDFGMRGTGDAQAVLIGSTTVGLDDGAWHHCVATFNDTTNTMSLYIDNGAPDTIAFTHSIAASAQDFTVGAGSGGSVVDANGAIDDVTFWTKELSAGEVSSLWAAGAGATATFIPTGSGRAVKGMFHYRPSSGSREILIVCGGRVLRWETDISAFVPIAFPSDFSGLMDDSARVSFAQLFDRLYFGNGADSDNFRYEGSLVLHTQGVDDAGTNVVAAFSPVAGGAVETAKEYAYKLVGVRQLSGARIIVGRPATVASAAAADPSPNNTIRIATWPAAPSDPGQTHWGLYRAQSVGATWAAGEIAETADEDFHFIADLPVATTTYDDLISQVAAIATGEHLGLHFNNRKTPPCQYRAVTNLDGADIMLQAGDPDQPDVLYPSSIVAGVGPDTHRSNFEQIVGRDDGDPITAIAAIFDLLIIFKEDSFTQFSPTFDGSEFPYRYSQSHRQIGCLSHWSVANLENTLKWYCDQGFYEMKGTDQYGNLRVRKISRRINPFLGTAIVGSRQSDVVGLYVRRPGKHQYRAAWTPTGQTTNTLMVPYDPDQLSPDPETKEKIGAWASRWTAQGGIDFEALAAIESAVTFLDEVWVGDSAGRVFKMDDGTSDNGNAIISFFHGAHYGKGSFTQRWREIILYGQSTGSLNLSWAMDYGTRIGGTVAVQLSTASDVEGGEWGQDDWGEAEYGGSGQVYQPLVGGRRRIKNATGHHFQLRVEHAELDKTWTLHAWELASIERPSRRMVRV